MLDFAHRESRPDQEETRRPDIGRYLGRPTGKDQVRKSRRNYRLNQDQPQPPAA